MRCRRCRAGLDAVAVDRLGMEADAERFLTLVLDLPLDQLVRHRDKIDEFKPMHGSALGVGRCSAGGEDRGEAAGCRAGAG